MPTKLTNEIITAAIAGYESQKTRIDQQIAELRSLLTGGPAKTAATADGTSPKRKKFSAATRRKMREAQQRRWAKIRGASEPSVAKVTAKPKRKISAAGRKAIAEAARKRWAAAKAAKGKAAKPASKKAARNKTIAKKSTAKKAVMKEAAAETPTA